MKRTLAAGVAVAALLLGPLAGTASAHDHEEPPPGPPPAHNHMLVLGLQVDALGNPVGFRKCVDLAGGQALDISVHHRTVHTGKAGAALRKAGHAVVPAAPLTPFRNCADLEAAFG
ncbi:hypothetical protein ACH9EU_06835 [Kocuria sp. M1R5S2]|uniref:hypothetical protein n=1 Tax=Kocuria rhizosphaerae TaxID=3376285 RepID=UPI0037ABCCA8